MVSLFMQNIWLVKGSMSANMLGNFFLKQEDSFVVFVSSSRIWPLRDVANKFTLGANGF